MSYYQNAKDDAKEMALHFIDKIIEQIIENDEASDDLYNDYPDGDSYHHETHVDKWYDLNEAAKALNQLPEWKETDSGLWEGQEPKEAIGTQAAFTYGNAVHFLWRDIISEINEIDFDDFKNPDSGEFNTDALKTEIETVIDSF